MKDEFLWDSYDGFSAKEIHGRKVEFQIQYENFSVSGTGELLARQSPVGLIALEVSVPLQFESKQQRFLPSEHTRFRLERHANRDVADFRLWSCNSQP